MKSQNQVAHENTAADRRREERTPQVFEISVSTFNRQGDYVGERTMTSNVSKNGCRIGTSLPLEQGDIVSVARVNAEDPTVHGKTGWFEVIWVTNSSNGRTAGIQQISGPSLWEI
jgi:PilZ domain